MRSAADDLAYIRDAILLPFALALSVLLWLLGKLAANWPGLPRE